MRVRVPSFDAIIQISVIAVSEREGTPKVVRTIHRASSASPDIFFYLSIEKKGNIMNDENKCINSCKEAAHVVYGSMDCNKLINILEENQEKNLQIELDEELIPVNYHITEVSFQYNKRIDCGGDFRTEENLAIQLWVANDLDHRMTAGKAVRIIKELGYLLLYSDELPVLLEYGSPISLYYLFNYYIEENNLILVAKKTATDCPAKDKCGVEGCC